MTTWKFITMNKKTAKKKRLQEAKRLGISVTPVVEPVSVKPIRAPWNDTRKPKPITPAKERPIPKVVIDEDEDWLEKGIDKAIERRLKNG